MPGSRHRHTCSPCRETAAFRRQTARRPSPARAHTRRTCRRTCHNRHVHAVGPAPRLQVCVLDERDLEHAHKLVVAVAVDPGAVDHQLVPRVLPLRLWRQRVRMSSCAVMSPGRQPTTHTHSHRWWLTADPSPPRRVRPVPGLHMSSFYITGDKHAPAGSRPMGAAQL